MTRKSTELLIEELCGLASAGLTKKQAAEKIGYTYAHGAVLSKAHSIPFKKRSLVPENVKGRNEEICRRYLAGEMQVTLAEEFGLTRERVRQIIEKAGLVSETQRHAEFVAVVAGTVARKKLTVSQAAEMFKISRANAWRYCKESGIKPASMTSEEEAELDVLAQVVVDGESCRRAAGGNAYKASKVRRHLLQKGLNVRGRSRHDDFSKRRELIDRWRAEGLTWEQCAVRLSSHDGRAITYAGIYIWARKHMPHLFESEAA
ncbi:hypothetical protein [Agrobacterium sp. OT33]|uniref:hypothetical protein n=1 Tax=Agrobacterium sp. OT33 TaxID=2815338 RepID=UPI001A8D6424|nr:hypothetical protein [Agrobacterium sp. OT33]MBO0125187.1 hypothetical protein [Agrobacterium sp. OT33]